MRSLGQVAHFNACRRNAAKQYRRYRLGIDLDLPTDKAGQRALAEQAAAEHKITRVETATPSPAAAQQLGGRSFYRAKRRHQP